MTNGKGGRPPEYPLEEFKAAVEAVDLAGTQDVADQVGCSYELAHQNLNRLKERGEINHQKVANTNVWTTEKDQ